MRWKTFHDSQADRDSEREEEVVFKEDTPRMESSTPPSLVTANDLDIIIEGWERKFEHLSQCMQEIQLASRKGQFKHEQYREGQSRLRGNTGVPHRGDARGTYAVPREMRPHAPHSTAPFRRTSSEPRLSRLRECRLDFVQTSTSNLPSTRLHLRNLRATT